MSERGSSARTSETGSAGRLQGIQDPHLLSCLEARLVWDQQDPGHTTLPTLRPRGCCHYTSEIR